jgi:two-component system response regulator VicR
MTEIQNKKILVVEDEKPLSEAIKFKLERQGMTALISNSAEEAMDILKKESVDLIWLDLKLPKINGIEFLKIIRDNPDWKDKKVIIVSASGSDEMKERAKAMGILDYIVKNEMKLDDIIKNVANA